jgi:hypothetical protein
MRRDRIVHLLLLALGVAACRDQPPAAELGPASDPEPVLTETTRHVELRDMAGTGVTGELIVTPFPDSVMFHLSINDAAANSTLGARVQTGSCESPGPVVELLASVLTGALGNGRSQRSIYDDSHRLLDGAHVAAVYAPGADPERDRPIACATIPPAS